MIADMGHQSALPATLVPRLISREAAAAYLSISPGLFDALVKAGNLPAPKKLGERRLGWDRLALDAAVDCLPSLVPEGEPDGSWEDIDAA